jgi:medium-chain acyl-[acyl-carrier-protein] hydrolase
MNGSQTTTTRLTPWVICPKPNPHASLRLFCFPYAGGGAASYRNWSDELPALIEVCPIELPGRGTRITEPPFTRMAPLVEAIAPALLPYLDRPFAFFGHSMGALISFELAHLLRKKYRLLPTYLFISGVSGRFEPNDRRSIHTLPKAEFIKELRLLNGTPEAVLENTELMDLLLPILRADFAITETYSYSVEPPLSCPMMVFGGLDDPKVNRSQLEVWRFQTSATFSLQLLLGDHFFIHTAQTHLLTLIAQQFPDYIRC